MSFKTPKPPEPINVASTATAANTQNATNAQANVELNRLDQKDAFGNTLKFGADGTVSTDLGALGQEFQTGLAGLGRQYMATAGEGAPDSTGAFNQAYDLASANLEPRFQRAQDAKYTQLRNQGLDPTSEAFKSATADLNLSQNESRNNLVSSLQNQMFNQGLAGRQQTLAELAPGLSYGTGATSPAFQNYNTVTQDNVDVSGLTQANYQGQQNTYNQKIAQQNALYGALASLAGTATKAAVGAG